MENSTAASYGNSIVCASQGFRPLQVTRRQPSAPAKGLRTQDMWEKSQVAVGLTDNANRRRFRCDGSGSSRRQGVRRTSAPPFCRSTRGIRTSSERSVPCPSAFATSGSEPSFPEPPRPQLWHVYLSTLTTQYGGEQASTRVVTAWGKRAEVPGCLAKSRDTNKCQLSDGARCLTNLR